MPGRALLLFALCCLLWGSTWLVIKIGLEDLPPFLFGGVRMAIASVALIPIALRAWRRLSGREWAWIAAVGFFQLGISYAGVFASERFISSGLAATLFCSYPIWVVALAHFWLPGERVTLVHAGSALLGILGILLLEAPLIGPVTLNREIALAMLLPLGSSICSAVGGVLQKKHLGSVPLAVNLWAQTAIGAGVLFSLHHLLGANQAAHWTPRAFAALLYLAIPGTVVTFLALFWLFPRVPMALIGAIPLIDTVVAIALGAIILGEQVDWRLGMGGAFVLAGAALASRIRVGVPSASQGAGQL
ncbi:MAG TPA: EamA family transporter [Myxococcaceae bacterium]|nr:EamA family transporter [Myxococcaceae bacterium]